MKRPLCCVCAAFVAIVFFYLKCNPVPAAVYDMAEGSRAVFTGEVCRKECGETGLVFYLKNASMKNPGRENGNGDLAGQIVCYVEGMDGMAEPKSGSRVVVEGEISYFREARNPGGFDGREYYQILGVGFRLYRAKVLEASGRYSPYYEMLYRIRNHFETVFDRVLPEKEASIMKAVLLGNKSGLDEGSKLLFQKSGMAHILAISGLHITIIGMGLYKLLRKVYLPQLFCVAVSICVMTAYGQMTGMGSSAYRAVFMFGMQLAARVLKRTYDMLTAMAVAAVLILAEQPLYIYHAGFLLSFGAVLGIGCFGGIMKPEKPRIIKGSKGSVVKRLVYGLKASLCGSLGIFVVHFPMMLCIYYEFPVYSFFLNLVIIPAMPFVMVSGLACLAFGSLPFPASDGMAVAAGSLCQMLLSVFDGLCRLSLELPFAEWIVGRPENWRICVFAAAMFFLYASHQYGRRISGTGECGLPLKLKMMTVLAAVVLVSDSAADGASMTFLDVGQGDCIWIETAKGEHFLVDGGSSSERKTGQYTIVPYLKYMGVSRLDAVFLTHLDNDHISGVVEMLDGGIGDGIRVGRICISDAVIEDGAYEKLAALCESERIPLLRLKSGDRVKAYGLCFEVLHPDSSYEAASRNSYSLVMKLEFSDKNKNGKKVNALLTGDVEADGELAAARELAGTAGYSGTDIYKAAHHGSKHSNTPELISAVNPRLSIISCSEDNSYGHPHAETIKRLRNSGSDILVTKDTGAIMIKINKGKIRVRTYKEGAGSGKK